MVPGAVGNGVLQRTQLRSPGGLATPHAGFVQMFGASSDSWLVSDCSRKPQSMQAMAPGSKVLPQAGQVVGAPPPAFAAASAAVTDGKVIEGAELGTEGVEAGREAAAAEDEAAAAPTVCRAGAGAPAVNGLRHLTQRNCLPAEPSGRLIAVLQFGQLITCGMFNLVSL
jgi:hypothetical protein